MIVLCDLWVFLSSFKYKEQVSFKIDMKFLVKVQSIIFYYAVALALPMCIRG